MFSALKSNGDRLYDLARKGIVVERKARNVTVYSLDLVENDDVLPQFSLLIHSSGGFYVRSLISDLGLRYLLASISKIKNTVVKTLLSSFLVWGVGHT